MEGGVVVVVSLLSVVAIAIIWILFRWKPK